MKILVFAPHPDDEILGCGGSIVKYVKKGHLVKVVHLTNGEAGDILYSKSELAQIRSQEIIQSQKYLGYQENEKLNIPDGRIEYSVEIVNKLTEIIRLFQPEIIYFPHKNDAHRDHANTFQLAFEASKRAGMNSFQEIKGEPWSPSTLLCYEVWTPLANYNYAEDISDVIDEKISAMGAHKSQLANVAYDEAVKGLNRYRGAMSGRGKYAECFDVVKIGQVTV